jgi:ABC-type nitrate/sulfonate/bicarbonate transport system permease component
MIGQSGVGTQLSNSDRPVDGIQSVAADSGLGFMISNAVGNFEVSTRYVALIALAIFSIALFGLVTLLERILLRWQDA